MIFVWDHSVLQSSLPLHQCQQKFSAMDVSLRNKLKESIVQVAEKYGLIS